METVEYYVSTNSVLFYQTLILYCCPRPGLWRAATPIRVSLETVKGVGAKKVIFLRGASTPLDFVSLTYGSPTRFFLSEHTYLSLYGADRNAPVHTVGPGFAPIVSCDMVTGWCRVHNPTNLPHDPEFGDALVTRW
jgi:hypothetical protein